MKSEGQTGAATSTHSPETSPIRTTVAPPAGTRAERLLTRVDHAFAWGDGLIARWLPPEANPLAQSGAATNAALAVAIVSGIALLIWYSPSLQFAYSSLAAIEGRTLGGWVRAIHRYSSDLAMLFVLVHAGRMFFARKFSGSRWLPWVSGVALIGLIWFIGWTGYWLVWDQPAQQVAVTSMRLLDGLPIFGEPLGRLYIADRLVPSLLFFVVFFLHMLLPLAIAVGLAFHLLRVSRVKLFPSWKMTTAIALGVATTAWLIPAPLDAPAEMAVKAGAFTVDAWYLTPLALALRFKHVGLWVALFGTMALAAVIPWLLGRRRAPMAYQAVVEQSRCHACTQCQQDCPFDAITMVARTDGKRFPSQAFVDVSKCVGCGVCAGSCDSEGIVLPWFDTRQEENRIENEITAAVAAGGSSWVALIAGDIDNGLALFAAERWRERLPDYHVHFVPTASWVRPMFVEHLLKHGARGVLIVRDARTEAAARDGNRWVSARLAGTRTPVYRPDRAGGSTAWQVVDYDPARTADLTRQANAFRTGGVKSTLLPARRHPVTMVIAGVLLALVIAVAAVGPSHFRVTNPEPANPEFVFSFKAFGDHVTENTVDATEDATKPIHMRGRSMSKPQRAPVVVRLTIDGVTEERSYRAMGISKDGPALNEWRHPLSVGEHAIRIELITGPESPPLQWESTVQALPRRLHVVTFEPDARFRVE